MTKIYLAEGMRSNWQDQVMNIKRYPDQTMTFYDPRNKNVENERKLSLEEYGTWDLHYIKQCDIVFGYMERDNPSGVGMACELGYAFCIGKTVITVIESGNLHQEDRYIQFMKKVSHITFDTLEEGIEYLKTFSRS